MFYGITGIAVIISCVPAVNDLDRIMWKRNVEKHMARVSSTCRATYLGTSILCGCFVLFCFYKNTLVMGKSRIHKMDGLGYMSSLCFILQADNTRYICRVCCVTGKLMFLLNLQM